MTNKIICIVDDEEGIVVSLREQLRALRPKWQILGFSNGLDALHEVLAGNIDLVITDIAMPDMDGYELFSRVKGHDPALPVIMMTGFGYDPDHVLVRSKIDGLKDVLFKPFDVERLVALIDAKFGGEC